MTTPPATDRAGAGAPCENRDRGSTRVGAFVAHWRVFDRDPTLVTVRVENTFDRPRRLRLDNRLDGPVDPPRRHGVAERGWDEDGLTRTVPGGETVAVGYACHAPPETPPVDVRDGPVEDTDSGPDPVEAALRSLGDAAPPRAALPDDPVSNVEPTAAPPVAPSEGVCEPSDVDAPASPSSDADTPAPPSDAGPSTSHAPVDAMAPDPNPDPSSSRSPCPDAPASDAETPGTAHEPDTAARTDATPSPPRVVTAWFDAVEARVAAADRLSGDVRDATPVVASLGGRAGVETLSETLDDDAAALREVATRAAELAQRVGETAVPDVEDDR